MGTVARVHVMVCSVDPRAYFDVETRPHLAERNLNTQPLFGLSSVGFHLFNCDNLSAILIKVDDMSIIGSKLTIYL